MIGCDVKILSVVAYECMYVYVCFLFCDYELLNKGARFPFINVTLAYAR